MENIALYIVTGAALALSVFSILFAIHSRDKRERIEGELAHAHTRLNEMVMSINRRFSEAGERIDGIEKGLIAGGAEVNAIGRGLQEVLNARRQFSEEISGANYRMSQLAESLGKYWEHSSGYWSDNPFGNGRGAIGGGQVMAQGVASGNTISAAKARGRRRA